MGIKIIFLDVDGVLNCESTKERFHGYIGVEQSKISLLKEIVEATNAKIVLSSTWRLDMLWHKQGRSVKLDTYNYLVDELAKQGIAIFDITPHHKDSWRGREIQEWLNTTTEEIDGYVVIDDDTYDIAKEHRGHLLTTSWKYGLKPNAVKIAIDILNKEDKKQDK